MQQEGFEQAGEYEQEGIMIRDNYRPMRGNYERQHANAKQWKDPQSFHNNDDSQYMTRGRNNYAHR